MTQWRTQPMAGASGVLGAATAAEAAPAVDVKVLHAKIGELALEDVFIRRAREGRAAAGHKEMIDRGQRVAIGRQARALGLGWGSLHQPPRPRSAADLALVRRA